jgi:hypothetical protein
MSIKCKVNNAQHQTKSWDGQLLQQIKALFEISAHGFLLQSLGARKAAAWRPMQRNHPLSLQASCRFSFQVMHQYPRTRKNKHDGRSTGNNHIG